MLFFGFAFVVFAFLLLRMLPEKTIFLEPVQFDVTEEAKCYTFKQEEYVIINSTVPIHFLYEEGTDVAAYSVLSDNYSINTNEYINQKIRAVDFMLANSSINTKEEFYDYMSEVNARIAELDSKINDAVVINDSAAKNDLLTQREAAVKDLEVLKRAMQYVFTTVEDLQQLKNELTAQLNISNRPLTLDNLNFTVFGTISYALDGYEDTLSFDSLSKINDGYFDYTDRLTISNKTQEGKYILKSSATDRVIIGVRIPKGTYVNGVSGVIQKRDSLNSSYNMDKEGGYYHFLFRRIGIMESFPVVNILTKDDKTISGNVIDVVYNGDDQVLMVAVREQISYFSDKRIFKADLLAESYTCFAVPKQAVVQTSEGSSITVIKDATIKENVPVTIYKTVGNKTYLKLSENTSLTKGTEVLTKGVNLKNDSE